MNKINPFTPFTLLGYCAILYISTNKNKHSKTQNSTVHLQLKKPINTTQIYKPPISQITQKYLDNLQKLCYI